MRAFLLPLLLSSSLACAQDPATAAYVPADLHAIVTAADPATGRAASLDLARLDAQIEELARHARGYPPRFANDADKAAATGDAGQLMTVLDILNGSGKPNVELLRRAGFVDSMAHNLDVPKAAQKAAMYFDKLLDIAPDDPQGNFMYGAFLGAAGKPDAAQRYLLKADSLGVVNASFALGVSCLMLGNQAKALDWLEKYQSLAPEDKTVPALLAAIRAGKFTRHTAAGKP